MAEKTKMITSIGGQALVEGIMMRGPKITAIGVRKPNGEIDVSEQPTENLKDKYPILGYSGNCCYDRFSASGVSCLK